MKLNTSKKIVGLALSVTLGAMVIAGVPTTKYTTSKASDEVTQTVTSEPLEFIVPEAPEEEDVEDMEENSRIIGRIMEVRGHADGNRRISMNGSSLIPQCLPDAYYNSVDYSSFWPWEPFSQHWTVNSDSYNFLHQPDIFTDENGLIRKPAPEGQFHLYGDVEDDYVVALGSFYKTKHVCGERFLVITTTGAFTITCGDEQADGDTDRHNMFIWGPGNQAKFIEFIVNTRYLNSSIRRMGTVTAGPIEPFKGEIISMLRIA